MYVIRPRKDLRNSHRNLIYRAICNGNLPPDHIHYPGIKVDEHDLPIMMDEIVFTMKRYFVNYPRRVR